MNSLQNKVALVSGSSRGLGEAMVTALAARGAKVAINYLKNEQQALKVKDNIVAHGGQAEVFQGDVTQEESVVRMCREVTRALGEVDILVLNATSDHRHLPIEQLSWDDMLEMLTYFVKSPLLLAKATVGAMKRKKWGRIIHIGSEAFEIGMPEFSNYVAAKGAQLGLARSWATELAPYNITVNLIAPGWIPTEMHRDTPEQVKQDYAQSVPMQHMGEPQDVAATVAFLASEEAKFITGQKISVNGGNTYA